MVNQLISRYLESFVLRGSYELRTLNQSSREDCDLVISNYAFSELPIHIQETYIDKVIGRTKKGYLTMNSGRDHAKRNDSRMSMDAILKCVPNAVVYDERPTTRHTNYIIVWGNQGTLELGGVSAPLSGEPDDASPRPWSSGTDT